LSVADLCKKESVANVFPNLIHFLSFCSEIVKNRKNKYRKILCSPMKCTACGTALEEEYKHHYGTELHRVNVLRKSQGIPPLQHLDEPEPSVEEKEEMAQPSMEEKTRKSQPNEMDYTELSPFNKNVCLFCDYAGEDIDEHIEIHEYDGDLAKCKLFVENNTCIHCLKQFKTQEDTRKHMKSLGHYSLRAEKKSTITIESDGPTLSLDNGKILGSKEYLRYFKQYHRPVEYKKKNRERNHQIMISKTSKEEHEIRIERKNDLKVSLGMNHQKHFREQWLQ
jgi:hypothetical protein